MLSNPAPSANRYLRVHDFYISQLEIINVLEHLVGTQFAINHVDPEVEKQTASAGLARGEVTPANISGLLISYVYSNDSTSSWGSEDDTTAIGVLEKDFEAEIRKVLVAA